MKNKKGFTLIELLAVIVILAVIMIIAVPQILNVIESSKKSAAESSIKLVKDAIKTQVATSSMMGEIFDKTGECYVFDFKENNANVQTLSLKNKNQIGGSIKYCNGKFEDDTLTFKGTSNTDKIVNECSGKCTDVNNDNKISFGDIISFEGDEFYVIDKTENTLKILPKYRLDYNSKRQNENAENSNFSESRYWDYPLSSQTDDYVYNENSLLYPVIEDYIQYLKTTLNIKSASGRLASYNEMKNITDQHTDEDLSWLTHGTDQTNYIWLGTPSDGIYGKNCIYFLSTNAEGHAWYYTLPYNWGDREDTGSNEKFGIKPLITISIDELK